MVVPRLGTGGTVEPRIAGHPPLRQPGAHPLWAWQRRRRGARHLRPGRWPPMTWRGSESAARPPRKRCGRSCSAPRKRVNIGAGCSAHVLLSAQLWPSSPRWRNFHCSIQASWRRPLTESLLLSQALGGAPGGAGAGLHGGGAHGPQHGAAARGRGLCAALPCAARAPRPAGSGARACPGPLYSKDHTLHSGLGSLHNLQALELAQDSSICSIIPCSPGLRLSLNLHLEPMLAQSALLQAASKPWSSCDFCQDMQQHMSTNPPGPC